MKYQKPIRVHDDPTKIYLRILIIKDFLKGMSLTNISKKENCTIKTVKKWVDDYKKFIDSKGKKITIPGVIDKDFNFYSKARTRRISIPFKVRKYILKKFSNKNTGGTDGISLNYILSQINSSAKLRRKLNFDKKISRATLHRFVKHHFGKPYRLRVKPKIKKEHISKRKEFSEYIKSENIKSEDIFFTDEKIFVLEWVPNKQTNQVRLTKLMKRKLNQNDEEAEKLVTIQLPKKSKGFMVGGGISKYGLGKLIFCIGTVDSFAYKQALEYYKKDIEALSPENSQLFFQQDNATPHTSKEAKESLKDIKTLKFWPPNSPEISPIEKVWSFIMRKLEGKKIMDLNQLKREVLYIWNRIPKIYCKKIVEKFDKDIINLAKNGGHLKIMNSSSYNNYKLKNPAYPDKIENIIYNKSRMQKILEKKRKDAEKLLLKKRKRINKLKTKTFFKSIKNVITKKYRVHPDFITAVIEEEIKPYEDELKSYEKFKMVLDKKSVENYFQNLKQEKKEKMISISDAYDDEDGFDEETAEYIDSETEIKNIINKAFNKPKELIRGAIKKLIEKK